MKFSRRSLGTTLALSLTLGIIITQGNACSEMKSVDSLGSASTAGPAPSVSDTGGVGSVTGGSNDITVLPNTKTVSLVYSRQILDQMSACLGVQRPSDATLAMYEQKKGSVSTYGTANTVTSPMMMAVISIAGEVCNDLINQENAGTKRLFKNFDFASTALPDNASLQDAVSRLSLSCWQRSESMDERTELLGLVSASVKNGDALAARKSAMLLCTSVVSSLDALLN